MFANRSVVNRSVAQQDCCVTNLIHKGSFVRRILCAKERLHVGYALGKLAGLQNLQEAEFDSPVARRGKSGKVQAPAIDGVAQAADDEE